MKKTFLALAAATAIVASGFAYLGAHANDEQRTGFTKSEIEGIVRDYLLSNPEIMYEVQAELERKQREEMQAAAQRVLSESAEAIFDSPHDGVMGNPDGDVTVVEFFDYNCGFCKRAMDDMEALLAEDEDLRFVLKDFPILGPDSQAAHVVSMAVQAVAPERYGAFHTRLMGSNGRANEEKALEIARDLGIDEAALRAEMQNPRIAQAINATYQLAEQLQISGTPSYVVGTEVVYGALGKDVLSEKIAEARQ